MMKRLALTIASIALVTSFSLTACGKQEKPSTEITPSPEAIEPTETEELEQTPEQSIELVPTEPESLAPVLPESSSTEPESLAPVLPESSSTEPDIDNSDKPN